MRQTIPGTRCLVLSEGGVESINDMFKFIILTTFNNCDYIKPRFFIDIIFTQESLGCTDNIPLLGYRDCFARVHGKGCHPRFYFYEYYEAVIFGNNIYFPVFCGPVFMQYTVAPAGQVFNSLALTFPAQ